MYTKSIKDYAVRLLDKMFPHSCGMCLVEMGRGSIEEEVGLCHVCYGGIVFASGSRCRVCGIDLPLGYSGVVGKEEGSKCVECSTGRNVYYYDSFNYLFKYDEVSARLILNYKFNGDFSYIRYLSCLLYGEIKGELRGVDYIVPVPMHGIKFWRRGYNQSVILAKELAREYRRESLALGYEGRKKLVVGYEFLRKERRTKAQSQTSSVSERVKNLRGSLAINERHKDKIRGSKILLVDDTVTTGVTLGTCAYVLKRGGAREVSCAVLSRVEGNFPKVSYG